MKRAKAGREWVENGVQMVEAQLPDGEVEPCFVLEDLPKFICSLDPNQIQNPEKRHALILVQQWLPTLSPAQAYREAVEFMEACGATFDPEVRRLRPRAVKAGAK